MTTQPNPVTPSPARGRGNDRRPIAAYDSSREAERAVDYYGLLFGAVLGAIFGLIMHALQGGRRDFASVQAMTPSRYEVVANEEVADQAEALLAKMSGAV
jgi:hypothetical protein